MRQEEEEEAEWTVGSEVEEMGKLKLKGQKSQRGDHWDQQKTKQESRQWEILGRNKRKCQRNERVHGGRQSKRFKTNREMTQSSPNAIKCSGHTES